VVSLSIDDEIIIPVSASGDISICPSQNLVLTAAAGFENYTWNGVAGSATLIVSEAGTYSVSAITPQGCPANSEEIEVSLFEVIELNTAPVNDVSICSGATTSLSAEAGFTDYAWSTPEGNLSGLEIEATAQGVYTVTAIDLNGCGVSSGPITVSFFDPQVISTFPSENISICPEESISITAEEGFTNYVWTSASLTLSGDTIMVAQAGTFTVSATDQNGCIAVSNSVSVDLITPTSISVSPGGSILRCPNLSVTLSASQGFTNYNWSPGNVMGTSYTLIDAGEYFVTATSPEGCTVTSNTVSFGFYPIPPLIGVNPQGPITICQGESVDLIADTGYTQYLWNTNNTGPNVTIDESGTYIITANDTNGCAANSGSVQVTVDPVFLIETNPSGIAFICDDGEVTLVAENGLSDYQWSNLDTSQNITVTQEGAYSVSAVNENGCSGSSEAILVSFQDSPLASFNYEQINEYNVVFENTTQNGDSFSWSFPQNITSEEENPTHNFPFDGSWPVSLIACNDCGCDTLDTFVEVIKTSINNLSNSQIQVVHQNKTLLLKNLRNKPSSYELQVYNAQGQLIIRDKSVLFSNHSINLGNVSSGIYIVQLLTEEGALRKRLFLSEK
jgi:hypothetical protein